MKQIEFKQFKKLFKRAIEQELSKHVRHHYQLIHFYRDRTSLNGVDRYIEFGVNYGGCDKNILCRISPNKKTVWVSTGLNGDNLLFDYEFNPNECVVEIPKIKKMLEFERYKYLLYDT